MRVMYQSPSSGLPASHTHNDTHTHTPDHTRPDPATVAVARSHSWVKYQNSARRSSRLVKSTGTLGDYMSNEGRAEF